MKPRGEYLSRLVGEVIQIWLPPMPPDENKERTWIERQLPRPKGRSMESKDFRARLKQGKR